MSIDCHFSPTALAGLVVSISGEHMGDFIKKIYSVFLRQNWNWLEQYAAVQSRPMLIGILLFVGYIIILAVFNLPTSGEITAIVLGISLVLFSVSGILWLREDQFPHYITGIFRGSRRFQKFQALFWVVFWGGMGLALILSTLMGW